MAVWNEPETCRDAGPVLFLDRDGVVIEDRDYLGDPEGVVLLPGAAEAMARAKAAGFALVGVSNQSGLGRGRFGQREFEAVMRRLDELLAAEGVNFDGFYYCPHGPEDGCACRKPLTGLVEEAGIMQPWIPQSSWVVGDKVSDIGLALSAGCGAILVRTGYGAAEEASVTARWGRDSRVQVVDDLAAAVALILEAGT